ncbi:hypothetical protein [Oerskovia sp. KBS0722]|uniref:hypothetical protein n=1 Tax=Oerskovia sp. KBS0722 TaxID=1179673 RepID=UPI00110D5C18|nr:hypothetical protein [Oerskovia sp. KBS0722]QDW62748.1 hypothetical protein FFI11_009475 [Oerskovia sp. KBS0722]
MHDNYEHNLYPSLHFTMAMPDGPDSKDLPMLLERLAAELRELAPPLLSVVAITYELTWGDDDELQPSFTVVIDNPVSGKP